MAKQSAYEILGVAPGATDKELRLAYRRQALKVHPDQTPGDKAAAGRFQALRAAYDELKDGGGSPTSRRPSSTAGRFEGDEADLRDLFSDLFTEASVPPAMIELSLTDVACGTKRRMVWRGEVQCPVCGGVPLRPCARCTGTGVVREEVLFNVTIPPGLDDGARLRVLPPSANAPQMWVQIRVRPDPCFRRRGPDLETAMSVGLNVLSRGGQVRIATPTGRILEVKIPAGSVAGQKLRLRGQGLPSEVGTGDLYLELLAAREAIKKTPARTPPPRPRKSRRVA